MAFIRNSAPPAEATVTITSPSSTRQTRIAFNAALVRAAGLADITHVAIDVDETTRSVVFHALRAPAPEIPDDAKFPLMRDGGQKTKKTACRAVYVHRDKAAHLVEGKYPARFKVTRSGAHIEISLDPRGMVYEAVTDVPAGTGGVYRLVDGDGMTIDIGLSESDVRGRIRTKLANEPETTRIIVYPLGLQHERLHWERIFQRRHVERYGALPKHCAVLGPGCGCPACGA
jgi:hypothetical protein